jgi:hypothetical protein
LGTSVSPCLLYHGVGLEEPAHFINVHPVPFHILNIINIQPLLTHQILTIRVQWGAGAIVRRASDRTARGSRRSEVGAARGAPAPAPGRAPEP